MSFWRFTSLLIARVSVCTLGAGAWGGQRHQIPLELGLGENELFDLSSGNQTQGPVQTSFQLILRALTLTLG